MEVSETMLTIRSDSLRKYLASLYGSNVEIRYVGKLSAKREKPEKDLKEFGYGVPYVIEFSAGGRIHSVVLETMRQEGFGHDHFSDRAQTLLWQHSAFNKLPGHVRSVDVGVFTRKGDLQSLGDCEEFFIVTEKVEGQLYHQDLDRIREEKRLNLLDESRCEALASYLAKIHATKGDFPGLYVRRVRDLLGHGEGIMGLTDSYPLDLEYISKQELCNIEKMCVEWRWKLKQKMHRCSQVHGDYHPWNVMFRKGVDFTVLDRSRGEWGEPADDVSAMSINYIFYGLQVHGELKGPFEALFSLFWETYMNETGDEEMLSVIQPYFAWRGLVIASPVWYPRLSLNVRKKLLNFVCNMLLTEEFDVKNVNLYLRPNSLLEASIDTSFP